METSIEGTKIVSNEEEQRRCSLENRKRATENAKMS